MEKFVDCSTLNTHRRCQTFGGYVLTIEGPCYLNVDVCGYKLNHPFYVLDEVNASAPIVAGIDLMTAAEMEINLKDRCVWSRRTKSSLDSSESTNSTRQSSGQKAPMLPDKRTSSVIHAIDASDVAADTAALDVSRTQSSHACNCKTIQGTKANPLEVAVRYLDNASHLLVPEVRRREPEALSQRGIETKPVIAINRLAPGTMEVDATTLMGHDKDMMDKTVDLDHGMSHLVLDKITTRGLDRITNRLDHVVIIGPRSIMGHRHQETSVWSTTMEISHAMVQHRPLNGGMAHQTGNGSQWDQLRSQSLSPRMGRRQRSCWVCDQVGCHSRNHPPEEQAPNQQQQFREPSAPQQRQGSPPNNNTQAPGNNFRGPRMGARTPSPARPAFQ